QCSDDGKKPVLCFTTDWTSAAVITRFAADGNTGAGTETDSRPGEEETDRRPDRNSCDGLVPMNGGGGVCEAVSLNDRDDDADDDDDHEDGDDGDGDEGDEGDEANDDEDDDGDE